MKRLTLTLSLLLLLFASACSVLPGFNEIAYSTSSDPNAGTPVVSTIPAQPNVITATAPAPGEVVLTPAPVKTEDAAQPSGSSPAHGLSGEQFDTALIAAIESKDFGALRKLMGPRFTLAYWRSEGNEFASDAALAEMSQSVLAAGATPAASTGVDTTALLDGSDPLAYFQPDAARAVYFDFVGPQGTDQALAIIGRDPATGIRYWKGMLVAFGGFRSQDTSMSELNQFLQQLGDAFLMHDFTTLEALMGEQFSFARLEPANLDGSLNVVSKAAALDALRAGVLAPGSDPVILWNTDIPALLNGSDPLGLWGPNAPVVRAVHFSSLGVSNQGEAVLVIGREPSGRLYWHGMLQPLNGETFGSAQPGPVGDALPTDIRYVVALDDLNARSGPGLNYAVEGRVREGEVATVTGISPDRQWWQFVCSQDASGRCWISADPALTQVTALP